MLSKTEKDSIARLLLNLRKHQKKNALNRQYLDAKNLVKNLGISVPRSLEGLEVAPGWISTYIDELTSKIHFEGWRCENPEQASSLRDVFRRSNLTAESRSVIRDSVVYGVGFFSVGRGNVAAGEPPVLVLSESPFTTTYEWDVRRQAASLALKVNWHEVKDGKYHATGFLYTMQEVIGFRAEILPEGEVLVLPMEVDDMPLRYNHGFGRVPIVPNINERRANSARGNSVITQSLRNTLNNAMRTILRLEIQSEMYSAPQRALLNVDMDMFTDPKTGKVDQSSLMNLLLGYAQAIPQNPDGSEVKPHTWAAHSPDGNIQLLQTYARQFASEASLPFEVLGVNSQSNPTSADALKVSQSRLLSRAESRIAEYQTAFAEVGTLVSIAISGSTELPEGWGYAAPKFRNPSTPTLAQAADAMLKLVSANVLPSQSRVVLESIGLDDEQITLVEQERAAENSQRLIEGLAALAGGEAPSPEVAGMIEQAVAPPEADGA